MSDRKPSRTSSRVWSGDTERFAETTRRKRIVETISNEPFSEWYQEKQFTENILKGRPYFNGASPPPGAAKHSPSKLLQCNLGVRYYTENAPQEGDPLQGLFWVESKFEEEIVLPYLSMQYNREYVRSELNVDRHHPR
jgi:hypothetical protein